MRAAITAVAHHVPETVYDNTWFEERIATSDEWITTRTGIKERHFGFGVGLTDILLPAAQQILAQRNLRPEDIDCIIVCTITADRVFPAAACLLQAKLGATNAWGFDLSAACSGFLFGLVTAAKLVESGAVKNVLLCGGDMMSSILDFTDRTTCVLFGDGGGAVLIEPTNEDAGVIDHILHMDGHGEQYLRMSAGGSLRPTSIETVTNREHFVYQEGQAVFKSAVKGMSQVSYDIMLRNNLSSDDIAWLVPHQANLRIIDATAERMGLAKDKVVVNIDRFGNTTAGTIPICLSELHSNGSVKKGDNIVLASFGAGYTWGAVLLRWAIGEGVTE